jgi:hypothetical protein
MRQGTRPFGACEHRKRATKATPMAALEAGGTDNGASGLRRRELADRQVFDHARRQAQRKLAKQVSPQWARL